MKKGGRMAQEEQEQIRINGATLTEVQLAEIESNYGVRPISGDYWYDAQSGLYGVMGQFSAGFMLPGHEFGALARDASAGNTGIIVNGRELPQLEWMLWSQMLGLPILPGSYWLDHNGNAGYEGNPNPVVNLLMAAQQQAPGGGNNIWSTRFSSGNFDSGNQRGYVSVPGHGPIGYGF
jgi:hypothetical protein